MTYPQYWSGHSHRRWQWSALALTLYYGPTFSRSRGIRDKPHNLHSTVLASEKSGLGHRLLHIPQDSLYIRTVPVYHDLWCNDKEDMICSVPISNHGYIVGLTTKNHQRNSSLRGAPPKLHSEREKDLFQIWGKSLWRFSFSSFLLV